MCCPPLPFPPPENETDTRVWARSLTAGATFDTPVITHAVEGDNVPASMISLSGRLEGTLLLCALLFPALSQSLTK